VSKSSGQRSIQKAKEKVSTRQGRQMAGGVFGSVSRFVARESKSDHSGIRDVEINNMIQHVNFGS